MLHVLAPLTYLVIIMMNVNVKTRFLDWWELVPNLNGKSVS